MGATTIRDQDPAQATNTELDIDRNTVDAAYLATLDRLAPPIRVIVGRHIRRGTSVCQERSADTAVGSALVLAAARAVGVEDPPLYIAEAVAIDAVHDSLRLSTLAETDSHLNTSLQRWSVFSPAAVALASEALLAVALNELTNRPSLQLLARAVAQVRLGRATLAATETPGALELAECLRIVERTTAALVSCACEMGAAAAGADAAQRISLAQFGRHLGMAYQLTSDIRGIWGRPRSCCAPARCDLADRKATAPIVAALTSTSNFAEELNQLYCEPAGDEESRRAIAQLAELTGARDWAEQEADKQLAMAIGCLSGQSDIDSTELRLLVARVRQMPGL